MKIFGNAVTVSLLQRETANLRPSFDGFFKANPNRRLSIAFCSFIILYGFEE